MAAGKKKFKVEYALKDLKPADIDKEAVRQLEKLKPKPVKYEFEASLDEDEWDEDRIKEEMYYGGFKMAVKFLDEAVEKAAKDKDPEKALEKAWKTFLKDAESGLKRAAKELEKGGDAKTMGAGAEAIKGMNELAPEKIAQEPRNAAIAALETVTKARGGDDKSAEATERLDEVYTDFRRNRDQAIDAIDELVKIIPKLSGSKEKKLKDFGSSLKKDKSTLASLKKGVEGLDRALKEAVASGKRGTLKDDAEAHLKALKAMSGLDAEVKGVMKTMKSHAKTFSEIEESLPK